MLTVLNHALIKHKINQFQLQNNIYMIQNLTKEISAVLPEGTYSRLSLQMDLPDAELERNYTEGLGWNSYISISISDAGF